MSWIFVKSTECWNVSGMSFVRQQDLDSVTGGTNVQAALLITSIYVDPTGTYLFALGTINAGAERWVHKFTLGINGSTSGMTWVQRVQVDSDAPNASGMTFKPDGSKMHLINNVTGSSQLVEFGFGTNWDLSTLTPQTAVALNSAVEHYDADWNGDGTQLLTVLSGSSIIRQYDASTPYDRSTISNPSISYTLSSLSGYGIRVRPNNQSLYIVTQQSTDTVRQYNYGTPDNITTLSLQSEVNTGYTTEQQTGVAVLGKYSKIYFGDLINHYVREYDMSC